MLNIITTSLHSKNRGPKKVVENLIKGLEEIKYPYVVNRALDSTLRLWIHDDTYALKKIKKLPQEIKIIIGPNLYVNPENIPSGLDLSKTLYIHPSRNVVEIWKAKGYKGSEIVEYPSGVDTEFFKPDLNITKEEVLIYFKNRSENELNEVTRVLNNKKINFSLINYGKYKEPEYIMYLQKAKYIVWLGGYESQGIALLEALSYDIPILIIEKEPNNIFEKSSSTSPFWSNVCGLKGSLDSFSDLIDNMNNNFSNFNPRNFILENFTLKDRAVAFIKLYETHFGLSIDDGYKEALLNGKSWHGNIIKKYIKRLLS